MATISVLCFGATNCGTYRSSSNLIDLLKAAGHNVIAYPAEGLIKRMYTGYEQGDLSILTLPPLLLPDAHEYAGISFDPKVRHVGHWYWETDKVPESWTDTFNQFQIKEFWAPTEYVKGAAEAGNIPAPTYLVRPYVAPPKYIRPPELSFALDEDRFIFVFAFDFASIAYRKNPLGLIKAYGQAFSASDKVQLILKTLRSFTSTEDIKELCALGGTVAAPVDIIDGNLHLSEYYGLLREADCYVSPHRSEGFGLTMIEAGYLGKPVIATKYGGNMAFMPENYPLFVNYQTTPVPDNITVYGGQGNWAEPDIDHLAQQMRWAYDNQDQAKDIGFALQAYLYHVFDKQVIATELNTHLARNGIE